MPQNDDNGIGRVIEAIQPTQTALLQGRDASTWKNVNTKQSLPGHTPLLSLGKHWWPPMGAIKELLPQYCGPRFADTLGTSQRRHDAIWHGAGNTSKQDCW